MVKLIHFTDFIKRIIAEHGFSKYLLTFYKGMGPVTGIVGVVSIVAHDKVAVWWNIIWSETGWSRDFFGKRIIQRSRTVVDVYFSAGNGYGFTGETDNSFDV